MQTTTIENNNNKHSILNNNNTININSNSNHSTNLSNNNHSSELGSMSGKQLTIFTIIFTIKFFLIVKEADIH